MFTPVPPCFLLLPPNFLPLFIPLFLSCLYSSSFLLSNLLSSFPPPFFPLLSFLPRFLLFYPLLFSCIVPDNIKKCFLAKQLNWSEACRFFFQFSFQTNYKLQIHTNWSLYLEQLKTEHSVWFWLFAGKTRSSLSLKVTEQSFRLQFVFQWHFFFIFSTVNSLYRI